MALLAINLRSERIVFMVLALPAALLTYALLFRIFRAATSPLKSLPGPGLARFTRLWYFRKVVAGDFEKTNQILHNKYGKIVRIAPNEYSIRDEDSVKTIYGHGTAFTKGPWYMASGNPDPHQHDLFTDRNMKRHAAERRKVAQLYSMTNLIQYEPYVENCTREILKRFDDYTVSNATFSMQHWLQCYAFDLIGLITLNKRFGFLDSGEDKGGLLAALHQYLAYCASVGVYAEWHSLLSRILALLPANGMAYLFSFTQAQLKERVSNLDGSIKEDEGMNDFLTRLLKMHQEDPEKLSMGNVFTACITNIGAGSDTTSISLSAILYYLIQSPSSIRKLREEIAKTCASFQVTRLITFKEAQDMPFLQACIKEALRLHPATGLPLSRVVPKGGVTLCGQFFPENTVVGVNTWVIHRDQEIFGEDAGEFRPERWLEDAKKAQTMEKNYMPFGMGSRTCIGKNISLLEISKLVPELVRRYDMKLANPDHTLKTQNVWFVKQRNFDCTLSKRTDWSEECLV